MLKIQDILRAQDIKRWTIVRTVRNQSVAEHTFNVVMIARAIAALAKIDDDEIIKFALEHDLDEILTGDIPSPTKKRARSIGVDLNKLESKGKHAMPGPEVRAVVKAADMIENLWFLVENGVGRHAHEESVLLNDIVDDYLLELNDLSPIIAKSARKVAESVFNGSYFRHE